jgi:hypothetical protein
MCLLEAMISKMHMIRRAWWMLLKWYYSGEILATVGSDSNNQMFAVTIIVVEG